MIPAAIRTEILFDPLALLLLPAKIKEYGEKTARPGVYLSVGCLFSRICTLHALRLTVLKSIKN